MAARCSTSGPTTIPSPFPWPRTARRDGTLTPAAAEEELRARRIGSNELSAMDACRLIANAEELYHQSTHQYTDTIVSTPGQQDGLYWEVAEGQTPSPLGRVNQFAKSIFKASAPSKEVVSHGYSFRVMTTQERDLRSLPAPSTIRIPAS